MKKTILIVLALAGFAVQNGAADGGGFADFRKQKQAEILAAIDNSLATQAEKAISDNFAAVRKADVQVQTGVGGRNGNVGLNLIGAFAETDSHAFGWQLRAYGGRDIDSGANAGVFYRNIGGGFLLGGNAFADYEKHKHGEFVRYSLGMEVQNEMVSFAANYYIPLTDNKSVNATLAAFSRQGYDGKLRIAAPHFRQLKAAVDYYRFDGDGDTAKDKGFRYGMEWQPTPAFRLNLFYDDGAEKIGGDIAYAWTIGERQKRESNAAFSPDLFAAVSREYSQRIATLATGPGISLRISIVGIMTTAVTMPPVTTTARMTAVITTRDRMTMAAVTTTTTMTTTQPVTTTTTMTAMMTTTMTVTNTISPPFPRAASVNATIKHDFQAIQGLREHVVETLNKFLITLPTGPRPHVLTFPANSRNFSALTVSIISNTGPGSSAAGSILRGLLQNFRPVTATIVQGSEELVPTVTMEVTTTMAPGVITETTMTTAAGITETTMTMAAIITETTMTMAGMTTTTTMTAAAISTTTRTTTFATMFITLTANSAMGDSRFRGNDGLLDSRFRPKGGSYEMAALERRGNDKQPSFPRKRESKPLSFVYLRDSANGDLSPQMANRRVRKARS